MTDRYPTNIAGTCDRYPSDTANDAASECIDDSDFRRQLAELVKVATKRCYIAAFEAVSTTEVLEDDRSWHARQAAWCTAHEVSSQVVANAIRSALDDIEAG